MHPAAHNSLQRKTPLLPVRARSRRVHPCPLRQWFRHAVYATGVYTGYSAVVFPGVREAAARQDWKTAAEQLDAVCAAINRGTEALQRAGAAMEGGATATDS